MTRASSLGEHRIHLSLSAARFHDHQSIVNIPHQILLDPFPEIRPLTVTTKLGHVREVTNTDFWDTWVP